MSNVGTLLIILFYNIYQTFTTSSECDSLNPIDIQSASYIHSLILRVQPIDLTSDESETSILTRKVFVREIIKNQLDNFDQININDMIIIRIDSDIYDSCWQLLQISNIDLILFLNRTNGNEFDLHYPPVESTYNIRQNIDDVLHYETYSPQVIIKTQTEDPIVSNIYFLQCNSRGNPLPRLFWSKMNQIYEFYPTFKQCQKPCRIYSIQNKYQSFLYFQTLTINDTGTYICHARNTMNHTTATTHVNVKEIPTNNRSSSNTICSNLKFCNNHGQCLIENNQSKCLCNQYYFGDRCEIYYDEFMRKDNNYFLLLKSRFFTGCILFLICLILIVICFTLWILVKHYRQVNKKKITISTSISNCEQKLTRNLSKCKFDDTNHNDI